MENKNIIFKDSEFILITGPMFAGKSKTLIDLFYQNKNIEAFSPNIDTRTQDIISRDYKDKSIHCKKISNPLEITNSNADIIIVDEFQFLGPVELLVDAVNELKKQKKTIVMAGLDLLASGAEWQNYTRLKNICDNEIRVTAKCSKCEKPAKFTKIVRGDSKKSVQIESNEVKYEPRCYEHFIQQ